MSDVEYQKGEMDVGEHESMWNAFMHGSTIAGLIILMVVGYITFTLAVGLGWTISLVMMAVFGIAAGLFLGFGSVWIATVFGLVVLGVLVQSLITLFNWII